MNNNTEDLSDTYRRSGDIFQSIFDEIGKVIVGQQEAVTQILITILCDGHALIESNPGLGKTLTVSTLSQVLDLKFNRIQCTPDLMPSDITGTYVGEERGGGKEFRFEPGPVFANIVLVLIFLAGGVAVMSMIRENFPEFSLDMITVSVPFP